MVLGPVDTNEQLHRPYLLVDDDGVSKEARAAD